MYDVWCMMYDVWCVMCDVCCRRSDMVWGCYTDILQLIHRFGNSSDVRQLQHTQIQNSQRCVNYIYCELVNKVWCMTYDVRCVIYDIWCMMADVWCMMYDVWCMMYDDVWCVMYLKPASRVCCVFCTRTHGACAERVCGIGRTRCVFDVWCVMCDVWCVTCDVWCVMCDVWCVVWYMMCDDM